MEIEGRYIASISVFVVRKSIYNVRSAVWKRLWRLERCMWKNARIVEYHLGKVSRTMRLSKESALGFELKEGSTDNFFLKIAQEEVECCDHDYRDCV